MYGTSPYIPKRKADFVMVVLFFQEMQAGTLEGAKDSQRTHQIGTGITAAQLVQPELIKRGRSKIQRPVCHSQTAKQPAECGDLRRNTRKK